MAEGFIVDNSVVMSWRFKDETSQYADAILDRLTVYLDLAMRKGAPIATLDNGLLTAAKYTDVPIIS